MYLTLNKGKRTSASAAVLAWILPSVFTALAAWRIAEGQVAISGWDRTLGVALFYSVVWAIAIGWTLQYLREQDFEVATEGVVLPRRPLRHVFRRKRVVPFREIELVRVLVRSDGGWSARLWLEDGTKALFSSYEGLPRDAIDRIVAEIRALSGDNRVRVVEVPTLQEQELWSDPGVGGREPRK